MGFCRCDFGDDDFGDDDDDGDGGDDYDCYLRVRLTTIMNRRCMYIYTVRVFRVGFYGR